MIGVGKVWKAVRGGGDGGAGGRPPLSTIPRAFATPKAVTFEPPWDPADVVPSETRSADRFVPFVTATVLTTTSGKRFVARIINVSQTGVAVESDAPGLRAEEVATVGSRAVMPGRRIAAGMVLLFKKPLDPKVCRPEIIL